MPLVHRQVFILLKLTNLSSSSLVSHHDWTWLNLQFFWLLLSLGMSMVFCLWKQFSHRCWLHALPCRQASGFQGDCKTGFHFNERCSYSQYTVREDSRRNSRSGLNGRLCGMVEKHQNCENWHPRCTNCLLRDPRLSRQDSLSLFPLPHNEGDGGVIL